MTLRDDPRLTAFGLLVEVFVGVSERLERQVSGFDLRPLEFEVILRLGRSAGSRLRMTDLAAQAHVSTSGVTRIVDRLEADGLVTRVADPHDRRASFAQLTDTGQQRLDAILPGHLDIIETWFTGRLPDGRLEVLLDALRTVRDAVRPDATAGA